MTTDIVEEKPAPIEVPVETQEPASTTAPANDIDALLNEFELGTARQAEPEPELSPTNDQQAPNVDTAAPQQDDLAAVLQELSGDSKRVTELQTENDQLRAQMHRQEELKAFNEYAADLQSQMPSFVPEDYARTKLQALAHDTEISLAFDLRNTDSRAAGLERQKVEAVIFHLQRDPATNQQKIAELKQYRYRLWVAENSHAILRKATLGILNDAKKLARPIDEEQTQIHADVAFAMKGASAKITAEPPPDFGRMSDNELREYTKKNFGFV